MIVRYQGATSLLSINPHYHTDLLVFFASLMITSAMMAVQRRMHRSELILKPMPPASTSILIVAPPNEVAAIAPLLVKRGWSHRAAAVAAEPYDVMICMPEEVPIAPGDAPAPVVALASAAWIAGGDARGYDEAIDRARLRDDLPRVIAEWSHAERLATLERLAATFGAAPVADLLRGLRRLLERALADEDAAAGRTGDAHRIAGLAGTLGFAGLGRRWLRVAEGTPPTAATRRATVHALSTIGYVLQ